MDIVLKHSNLNKIYFREVQGNFYRQDMLLNKLEAYSEDQLTPVNLPNRVSRRCMNNRKHQYIKECFPQGPYCTCFWILTSFYHSTQSFTSHLSPSVFLSNSFIRWFLAYDSCPGKNQILFTFLLPNSQVSSSQIYHR